MRFNAKYCGEKEKFGVKPGEIHRVELNTYKTTHGSPYIWIHALDAPNYLMPFSSLTAMFREWAFEERGDEDELQADVEKAWYDLYAPIDSAVQ